MIDQFLFFRRRCDASTHVECESVPLRPAPPFTSCSADGVHVAHFRSPFVVLFFGLVHDLGHLAPPAKEIIGGADRCNQDRAQTIDQRENQSLLPAALSTSSLTAAAGFSGPLASGNAPSRLVEEDDARFCRPGGQRNRLAMPLIG